jgi:triacylglycerol lipase
MVVVLVDGIWGKGAVFGGLRARLEAEGHVCLVTALQPSNAAHGIRDLAEKLKRIIDREVGPDAPLAIVGFSMGCIVARIYLQQLGGVRRTVAFFALSGPHQGTWTAYGAIGKGARDLRPGSKVLQRLKSAETELSSTALFAYWTPFDLMIVPPTSARWRKAKILRVWTPLHRFVPCSRRVQTDILAQLRRTCGENRPAAKPLLGEGEAR